MNNRKIIIKKKIFFVFMMMTILQSGNSLSWFSKSPSPSAVSKETKKAEQRRNSAKKNADEAVRRTEQAYSLRDAKQAYVIYLEAKGKSAAARQDANNAQKSADKIRDYANKAGSGIYNKDSDYAQQLADAANLDAENAERLLQDLAIAIAELNLSEADLARLMEEQQCAFGELSFAEEYLRRAEEADRAYTQAWSVYVTSQKRIEQLERELQQASGSNKDMVKLALYNEQNTIRELNRIVEIKGDFACKAYEQLGEFYDRIGYVGDPVNIGNGEYIVEYKDFIAQDFLDEFTVTRKLCSSTVCDSFGVGWSCSLDSRIVQCVYSEKNTLKRKIEVAISECNNMEEVFLNYDRENPDFPREETSIYISEASSTRSDLYRELTEVNLQIERRNKLIEKNKYSGYGRFKTEESFYGAENQIIYLDENGREYYFEYQGSGKWITYGDISKNILEIYNIGENKERSNSDINEGGYEVYYFDENHLFYDKYGILYKKIDRNGNIVTYKSSNGKINEVITKTGETIHIERNSNGYITKIVGNVSGETLLSYNDNLLQSVVSNDEVQVDYSYQDNRLSQIIKADGTSISIEYEYSGKKNKYVCSKIKTKNGSSESFVYNDDINQVVHTTNGGKTEIYKINEHGNPIYIKDYYGNETIIETDENSMIRSVKKNGVQKFFTYDNSFRACEVLYENGGTTYINYLSENGNQIESIIDADGFKTRYVYDNKGNVIEQYLNENLVYCYEYYPSGLLKSMKDDEKIEKFNYNQYGSITKRTIEKKGKKNIEFNFEYDEKNRLSFILDDYDKIEIEYENGKRSQLSPHQKKIFYFDKRNRIIREETFELITNKKKTIEYEYDNEKIGKIYIDGLLYEEKKYSEDDELISCTKWNFNKKDGFLAHQGLEEKYAYNSKGFISEYIKQVKNDSEISVIEEYYKTEDDVIPKISSLEEDMSMYKFNYISNSGYIIVSYNNEMGLEIKITYNCDENIIKKEYPSGYFCKTLYTKAGRLKQQIDSENKVWDYVYKADGSYEVILSTPIGIISKSEYDDKKRLVRYKDELKGRIEFTYDGDFCVEEKGNEYIRRCEYDIYGRKIADSYTDLKNRKKITDYSIIYNDKLNTVQIVVGKNDSSFIYYQCKLDGYMRPFQIIDKNGYTEYEYDSLDRIISKKDGKGNITYYEYDVNNIVSYIVYPDNLKRLIKHNVNGVETLIQDDNKIQKKSVYDIESKKISVIDCFGTNFDFFYNSQGNVIREKNSKTGEFYYDSNILTHLENELPKIEKDICGNITRIKNDSSNLWYEYDLLGNITCIKDMVSDCKIEYEYDNFGRCIYQNVGNNEVFIDYDLCGNVSKVKKAEDLILVSFDYDEVNREISRKYWNGITQNIAYNKRGLIESKIQKDKIGQIIYCDLLLYDDMDRIIYKINKDGNITHYSYKNTGQIDVIEYPISEELWNYYLQEAIDCGYPLQENTKESVMYIDSKSFSDINSLLGRAGVNSFVKVFDYQRVWKEEYEYTKQGSISSIKNPLGKLIFTYDKKNRIQEKYYCEFPDNKMTFLWSDNGNLLKINGVTSKVEFTYTDNNRIDQADYINQKDSSRRIINFEYDGLNRKTRIYNSKYDNQSAIAYMYNGFSNQVIEKYTVFDNGIRNRYIEKKKSSDSNDLTYRYINDEEFLEYGTVRTQKSGINNRKTIKYDDATNEVNLILKGESVCSLRNNEYCIQILDYRKQSQLDVEYDVCNRSSFDAYGNDYSKEYNILDEIIDLGYRDYIPSIKSFTSEDPAKDGNNWYCYCPGDSVNYVDSTGFYIIPIPQTYLMTDAQYVNRFLGNVDLTKYLNDEEYRKKSCSYINKEGCYITSYANIVAELMRKGIYDKEKIDYSTVEGINRHIELFQDANLKRDEGSDTIFNSSTPDYEVTWDYFTKSYSGSLKLKIELTKAKVLRDGYAVVGIFDLSKDYANINNHMVILNDAFDEEGVFKSITASSENDIKRLEENPNVYNLTNLKEIRVIKVENKNCNK